MASTSPSYQNWLFPFIALFLAVALQVQVTLFSSEDYLGLRVNLADFSLPFLGLFILFSLLRKSSHWPAWDKPFGYWAIGLLSIVMLCAAVNGYILMGEWSSWAWINKCLGWFVLMAYMAAGGWLATNAPQRTLKLFISAFIAFFCLVTIVDLSIHFLYLELDINLYSDQYYPHPKGLMHNRNAFAFLFLCAAFLVAETHFKEKNIDKVYTAIARLFWLITPFFVLMNGSRALWLLIVPLLIFFGVRYKSAALKKAGLPLLCGLILLPLTFQDVTSRLFLPVLYTQYLIEDSEGKEQIQKQKFNQRYDRNRLAVLSDGAELAKQRPVTGSGLGGFIEYQKDKHGESFAVMDNTLLWILIDMGAIGLFSFVLVYIVMLHTLYRREQQNTQHSYISKAALFTLVAFGAFSLFHEILYSRFFWFILGMALVVPIARQNSQDGEASQEN